MRIAYYRVSTGDQSIDAQRSALGGGFDKEFNDVGVSGGTLASQRPGFAKMLELVRPGDVVVVYAVDRLGRDALDVQATVRKLLEAGVSVEVHGLGLISKGVGELILAVLAQIADMERHRIIERTRAGRTAARERIANGGTTKRGGKSLGRSRKLDPEAVLAWKRANGASIKETAERFKLSPATVKRYAQRAPKVG